MLTSPLCYLLSFSLSDNRFGDETGKALAQLLTTNPSLNALGYGRDGGVASLPIGGYLFAAMGQNIGVCCADFSPLYVLVICFASVLTVTALETTPAKLWLRH